MPISCSPEHKIAIFVRFCPSEPLFSGLSSTKRAFLCQKGQLFPGFTPFRAQNRGFCAWVAVIAETLTLSPASGRAIKKRVTSKSPNGLFSYPPLWIGICCRCFRIYKQRQTGNCSCLCYQLFCTCTQWRDPSYS